MTDLASSWANAGAVLTVHRWVTVIGGLLLASVAVLVLCLQFGATVSRRENGRVGNYAHAAWQTKTESRSAENSEIIMVQIRFPRVLMGFLVGAGSGGGWRDASSVVRNPLADPYVLGSIERLCIGRLGGHPVRNRFHLHAVADTPAVWICRRPLGPFPDLSVGAVKKPIADPQFAAGRRHSECHFDGIYHVHYLDHGTESLGRTHGMADGIADGA